MDAIRREELIEINEIDFEETNEESQEKLKAIEEQEKEIYQLAEAENQRIEDKINNCDLFRFKEKPSKADIKVEV